MKTFFKYIFFLAFLGLITIIASYAWLNWYVQQPATLQESKTVIIPKGTGISDITAKLANAGVIAQPFIFKAFIFLEHKQVSFKAGEYVFTPNVSINEIIDILAKGKSITHSITIAEGLTVNEIIDIIQLDNKLSGEITQKIGEGELLPETHFYLRGDNRNDIIKRMQKDLRNSLDELWQTRQDNLPLKNKYEALILASIVEKETGVKSERARVAAVFINRLRLGMQLQSDPTTIYGIYKETGVKKQSLTRKDLKREDEYNTYFIPALPPTPIANAGRKAIAAVLNPSDTKELYFVAKGDGGHRFANSLRDHQANVMKYRKWQRDNGLR